MSLKLWLPFTKDLLNYGTASSNITATNVTANTNGKLGGCYSFIGSSYLIGTHNFLTNDIGDWSFACWMKLNAVTAGQTLFSCRSNTSANGITVFYYGSKWLLDDGVRWEFKPTITIAANTWYHICFVRKKGVGKYLYINSVLDSSTTTTGTPTQINTTKYAIGGSQNSSTSVNANYLNGYLNDARFYDHALSMAEIKDISKGLYLHYKLDDFYGADNLIVNGYGELGTENWSGSSISTTEIPPDHPEIKASVYNGNSTKEYIPIIQSHSYTISGYIKQQSESATSTTYPSLLAYDIDKKIINCYHTKDGFNNNAYMTTLSQPLHKGDTVIHATDLSAWTTSSTNYYCYVAIFGYKNSLGQVYPDMTYTQDAPSFGTKEDKSNIDKTNNTITLLNAFTGEDRPAGTVICQSTAGSTYYYPWGGINPTTVTNWTFKTATFKPMNVNRFKSAAYIRWSTYGRLYVAGNRLVDNTLTTTEVVDSSGYRNHGTKTGNISVSYNSPRYEISTLFDSGSHIYTPALSTSGIANSYTFSWWAKYTNYSGHMMWGFSDGNRLNLYMSGGNFYWNTGDATNNPFNISAETYGDGNWHHFAVTGDGTAAKLYIDGTFKANAKTYKGITGTVIYMNGWNSSSSYNFNGQLSDFRLYATALSAEDVLALYNVGARVFKNGMMAGYELKEGD